MKFLTIVLNFILIITMNTNKIYCQQTRRDLPFQPGEVLKYSVYMNFIKAGEADMRVLSLDTTNSVPVFRISSKTLTRPFFDKIYKIRDILETRVDANQLHSLAFKKDISERKYTKQYNVKFNYFDSLAVSNEKTTKINGPVFDSVAMFYYIRAESLFTGKHIAFDSFDNDKLIPFEVVVRKPKSIKVPAGKFSCYQLEPIKISAKTFKYKNRISIYISNDNRKLPVKIINHTSIGSMVLKLVSY